MKFVFRILLSPLSVFYLLIVVIRNKLFDKGFIRSDSFEVPVICVGNLSTGGTGKTPHTEYIAKLLEENGHPVAILSRGYKRRTRGFIIAEEHHTHQEIGDEPCLYKQRLRKLNIIVAVDKDRRRGIRELQSRYPDIKTIILDDAFQHRYVRAGLNILLSDYYIPFFKDNILPFGNLREPKSGSKRADIIMITKSPPVISPLIKKDFLSKFSLRPNQHLFFSKIEYAEMVAFNETDQPDPKIIYATIFLFTGIANPYPLEEHLKKRCLHLEKVKFPDHYSYTPGDIQKILNIFDAHLSTNKIIVTTEKDKMRLQSAEIKDLLSGYPVFYVPIQVTPHKQDKEKFNKIIINYVNKNQRNQ